MRRVLVVDDEENLRHMLQLLLKKEGYEAVGAASVDGALAEISARPYDIVITDLRMPGRNGLELVEEIRRRELGTTVVVMTAYGNREVAIAAMKQGAYDYLPKPFEPDELVWLLRKAEERERLSRENQSLRRQLREAGGDENRAIGAMVARSPRMVDVVRTLRKIAEFKTTVLLQGESGTGKELAARALHELSPRAGKPFVAVNCGAIPAQLLESELFGHKKGAFTDAVRDRRGLFEEANGGTLFLDELGELPAALQVKLLRALQEGEIRRLGDTHDTPVDVRVVAATARDLEAAVRTGDFRADLFYRVNVVALKLPPLRERREDIPVLIEHFIAANNRRMGSTVTGVTPEALRALCAEDWPGNVRELENTIERAMVLTEGSLLDRAELTGPAAAPAGGVPLSGLDAALSGELDIREAVNRLEGQMIRRALDKTAGNRTRAAELLGISYRALLYKLKESGASKTDTDVGNDS